MLQRILHAIRYYPEQAFLFVFNTGIFAWLQATGSNIANQIGFNRSLESICSRCGQVFCRKQYPCRPRFL